MMDKKFLIFLCVGAFLCPLFSRLQAKVLDETALVVDNETMTQSELDEAVQAYFVGQQLKVPPPQSPEYQQALKQTVDSFIEEVLLAGEADRQKMEISDGELDHSVNQQIDSMKKGFATEEDFLDGLRKEGITLEDLRQTLRTTLLRRTKAARALHQKQQELPNVALVTEEQARAYYDKHPTDYEQVKISMILFRIPPQSKPAYVKEVDTQARQVLGELKGGADFAAYAKKYSEDTGTADKGGDVGSVYLSQMQPSLAKGILSIPEKSMGIVKTPEGVYIVKVDFKGKADYASVAPEIKDRLKREGLDTALQNWLLGLRKKAYVEYHGASLALDTSTSPGKLSLAYPAAVPPSQASPTPTPAPEAPPSLAATLVSGSTSTVSESTGPSSLPEEGNLSLYFRLDGWLYGVSDLATYYVNSVKSTQNFPFGFNAGVGLDLAVDQSFQLGLLFSYVSKTSENISDQAGSNEQWMEAAGGGSLSAKLIFPLTDGLNAVVEADGGYYLMLDSNLVYSGSVTATLPLNGAAFGGEAQAGVELFLDHNKATALDFLGGYRYLKIAPTTSGTSTLSNGQSVSSISYSNSSLPDANGNPWVADFSGITLGLDLKIYLDK